MKRIAALAALVIAILGVPATAMAGTGGRAAGPPRSVLAPAQEFRYDGNTYTIMSVNPGADSFTVFLNGWLFVNKGAAITDGIGFMGCARVGRRG